MHIWFLNYVIFALFAGLGIEIDHRVRNVIVSIGVAILTL